MMRKEDVFIGEEELDVAMHIRCGSEYVAECWYWALGHGFTRRFCEGHVCRQKVVYAFAIGPYTSRQG